MIQYSKLESDRFGYNIYKYSNLDEVDVKLLKKSILEKEADIVFLRLNSSLKRNNSKINSMGFPIIHADTLVYYVLSELSVELNYQFYTKGVVQKTGENTNQPSMQDLLDISARYKTRAEFYKERLINYLK
jgi:hypothetical protein